jgi:glutathione synthase
VLDYQLTHGSLIKLVNHPKTVKLPVKATVSAKPIGTSLVPTLFPRERFDEAWELQLVLQELFAKVACDVNFLYEVCKDCIADGEDDEDWRDVIITALWKIWEAVRLEDDRDDNGQDVEMGLCRGDWMLHCEDDQSESVNDMNADNSKPMLKQVEFNAIATAGVSHSNIICDMHKHLLRTGIYSSLYTPSSSPVSARQKSTNTLAANQTIPHTMFPSLPPCGSLPTSDSITGFANLLSQAHALYGSSRIKYRTAVLMVVQHENVNIADERPIEYALWKQSVPCFRVEYREILERTWYPASDKTKSDINAEARNNDGSGSKHYGFDDEHRARYKNRARTLLFSPFAPLPAHPEYDHPSSTTQSSAQSEVFEISVIYYRSSLTAFELSPSFGFMIRLHLERSSAIKCPSALGQLAASKKVQLALSRPGALERFLTKDQASKLTNANVQMYDLGEGSAGRCALEGTASRVASREASEGDRIDLDRVVLKPLSTEGGSHNTFPPASDIRTVYEQNIKPFDLQGGYMLMEMIRSPTVAGGLISGNHIRREHQSGKGGQMQHDGRGQVGQERLGDGSSGLYIGPVVSELGVLGGVIYRRKQTNDAAASNNKTIASPQKMAEAEILRNDVHGTTLKCKPPDVKEMNVIKGSGCFSTPWLVDWDAYHKSMTGPQ